MIDIKTHYSKMKHVENTPAKLLRNSIECFKDISKDGFFTLTAGKDENGNARVFTPFWSAVFFVIVSITLFITILISGACVYVKLFCDWIYNVIAMFCSVLCVMVVLPILYLTLGMTASKNTLTKFGMKISKAK